MAAKSMAEKQFDSVVKILGELAYEDVFVYSTTSELWTRLVIQNDEMSRTSVVAKFPKHFTVELDDTYGDEIMVRNDKLVA